MKKITILFTVIAFLFIGLGIYVLHTVDIYISCIFALLGAVYMFLLEPDYRKRAAGIDYGIPLLILVGILPLITSTALALMGFFGHSTVFIILRILLDIGFSISIFASVFPIPLALRFRMMEEQFKNTQTSKKEPFVSILVPAYNEQYVISRTISSLLELNYRNKEIIVIDDGSTDMTSSVASTYKDKGVKVLRKPNGGKSSALNYGILHAKGDIVVTIDADSMLARDGLKEIVKIMDSDPRLVAVGGNIGVLNNTSVLTKLQELEYTVGINLLRRAYSLFGAVMVVPGAFGAFRKDSLKEVGGYDKDTLTEDFDITVKLLKINGRISGSTDAISYTEVPVTLNELYKQRMRWGTGTFQVMYKHRDAFTNKRMGHLHNISFPLLMLSLFSPIANFAAIAVGIMLSLLGGLVLFIEMLLIFAIISFFVSLIAISLDDRPYSLALYTPIFIIGYKQFVDSITLISAFKAAFSKDKSWHKLQRQAGTGAISAKT